jgi:hypothetical protein
MTFLQNGILDDMARECNFALSIIHVRFCEQLPIRFGGDKTDPLLYIHLSVSQFASNL